MTDTRRLTRWPLGLPIRFRILHHDRTVGSEISSETVNISQSGLFLHTQLRLTVGDALLVSLHLPKERTASRCCYVHCVGHVIREQKLPGGQHGYGIRFNQELSRQPISQNFQPPFCTFQERTA